jgi:hypothetical protein
VIDALWSRSKETDETCDMVGDNVGDMVTVRALHVQFCFILCDCLFGLAASRHGSQRYTSIESVYRLSL